MNRSKQRIHPIVWGLAGLVAALAVQTSQALTMGGWSGLLATGEASPLRPVIEDQLGTVALAEDEGHDGHVAYVVALDPWAEWAHEEIPEAAYRYRRILLPAIAGGFGTINGRFLMAMLVGINSMTFAVAALAMAWLSERLRLPAWTPLVVIANVGLWLSLQITSPDVLAFTLSLVGLLACFRGRHWPAVAAFALSALAKEVYILIPLALAAYAWRDPPRRALSRVYLASVIPLGVWSLYLTSRLQYPFRSGGNLTWPLKGIVDASSLWASNSPRDLLFLILAIAAVLTGMLLGYSKRGTVWSWLMAPWVGLALVSSHWIWDVGNNAARAFVPMISLLITAMWRHEHPVRSGDQLADLRYVR